MLNILKIMVSPKRDFASRGTNQTQFWQVEIPKPRVSWFSRLLEISQTLRNLYSWLWICKITLKYKKYQLLFERITFGNTNISHTFFWQRRVPTHPWDPSHQILKVLNMGSVSPKNMKCAFGFFQLSWRNLNRWNLIFFPIKGIPHPSPIRFPPLLHPSHIPPHFLSAERPPQLWFSIGFLPST